MTETAQTETAIPDQPDQKSCSGHRTYLQVHWELDTTICCLVTTGESCYALVPQALCSIKFLTHVTFICIGSSLSYPTRNVLSHA